MLEEVIMGAFAMTGFFGSIILGLYLYFTTRHKERMSLIDHGLDASVFSPGKKAFSSSALKFGLLFLGVGVGIMVGTLLSAMGLQEEPSYFSSMLIFGGLGLISYYRIERKRNEAENYNS